MKNFTQILVCLTLIAVGVTLNAQTIIVQKADGTNARMFTNIDDAVAQADAGDFVYLSGGRFNIQSIWTGYDGYQSRPNWLCVDKPLHFVGNGYTMNTNRTIINGSLALRKSASGSSITGIAFESIQYFDSISNLSISRCQFQERIYLCGEGAGDLITECEFTHTTNSAITAGRNLLNLSMNMTVGPAVYYCTVSKSIFSGTAFYFLSNFTVNNNLFKSQHTFYTGGTSCSYFLLENNIFMYSSTSGGTWSYVSNSTFRNNLSWNAYSTSSSNYYENNMIMSPYSLQYPNIQSIFVDYSGGDYHLKDGFPLPNAGTDGTDVGIYGTFSPFKENRTTAYPQFLLQKVENETNGEGKLEVEMKVEAQTK